VSEERRPEWLQAYQAALLEVDPAKLRDRIAHAYAAIRAYRDEAARNQSNVDSEALSDALSNLRVLRREAGLPPNDPDLKDPDTPVSHD
jgi:hypothetical protein